MISKELIGKWTLNLHCQSTKLLVALVLNTIDSSFMKIIYLSIWYFLISLKCTDNSF